MGPLRRGAGLIAVVAMAVAYSALWSYVALSRLYSLTAFIGDLGIIVQGAWESVHSGPWGLVNALLTQSALLIYAPFTLLGGRTYEAVAVLQEAWLGAGAVPVYLIARRHLRGELPAVLLAASYLLYFPLSGPAWFFAHRQALFPTAFMASYYLYLRGGRSRYAGAALMVLSSTLRFPYEVFPLWLGLVLLARGARGRGDRFDLWAGSLMVIASALLIAYNAGLISALIHPGTPSSVASSLGRAASFTYGVYLRGSSPAWLASSYEVPPLISTSPYQAPWRLPGWEVALLTAALYLLPVLGLPLVSKTWGPALLPGLLLLFISPYPLYHYPYAFHYQYPSTLIAPVWLGTVEAVAYLSRGGARGALAVSIAVLASTSVTAALFSPPSPLSQTTFNRVNFASWTSYNMTYFEDYLRVVSLIPGNVPGYRIAAQANMPELLPRPSGDYLLSACGQYYNFTYILVDALHGFPALLNSSDACNGTARLTALQEADWALSHGYGVVAEEGGAMLLEANYSGPLQAFSPYSLEAPGPYYDLQPALSTFRGPGGEVNVSGLNFPTPLQLFYIGNEPVVLLPGQYVVTYSVDLCGQASPLLALVYGYYWNGTGYVRAVLANVSLSASSLPRCSWTEVAVRVSSRTVLGYVQATLVSREVEGWLAVRTVTFVQVAPP